MSPNQGGKPQEHHQAPTEPFFSSHNVMGECMTVGPSSLSQLQVMDNGLQEMDSSASVHDSHGSDLSQLSESSLCM